MLAEFTAWLLSLVKEVFTSLWTFVQDAFIAAFGLVVKAFVSLIVAIPVPGFIQGGLGQLWGGLDPGISYALTQSGVPAALALVGAGYAFRMLRKFVTLFQW